jgi:hypothetical protein
LAISLSAQLAAGRRKGPTWAESARRPATTENSVAKKKNQILTYMISNEQYLFSGNLINKYIIISSTLSGIDTQQEA